MAGYALTHYPDGDWGYRAVEEDWPLADGEVYYTTYENFPQEAKDWFASHGTTRKKT